MSDAIRADAVRAACQALTALTAAGQDAEHGHDPDDLIDLASDHLAELVALGEHGLAALLRLLDIAVGYGAAVSGQSADYVARTIVHVAEQIDQ